MNIKQLALSIALVFLAPVAHSQTLKEALDKKDTLTAAQLIKKGGDVNQPDKDGTTALMTACRWADEPMVRFLLGHGAIPDKVRSPKGRTELMVGCAYYSGKGISLMLVNKGADINAVSNDGITPLMLAAQNAKLDVVELLLKHGAKVNAKDNMGKTALDYANKAEVSDYLKQSVKDSRLDKDGVIKMLQQAMK